MQKLLLFLLMTLLTVSPAFAQEATPSPTSKESPIQKKIDDLKERLATRVAELKTQNKKAFYGVIKQKEDGKVTLSSGEVDMPVTYDKDTKITVRSLAGKKTDSDDKMLTVGSNVAVFGTLDLDQKTLLAKYMIVHDQAITTVGTVKSIDIKQGSFVMTGEDGETNVEYEISTKCRMWDGETLVTCGLSKVKPTDKVIVRISSTGSQTNKGVAIRMVLLPTQASPDSVSPSPTAKPAVKATPTTSQ